MLHMEETASKHNMKQPHIFFYQRATYCLSRTFIIEPSINILLINRKNGHAISGAANGVEVIGINFLFFYVNLIRVILIVITIVQLFKRDYKKLVPAAIVIALTFVPWLLGLIHIPINMLTGFLFPAVVFMGVYLGEGLKYYDLYPWWDRSVHFLSGILFFSFGISLTEKAYGVSLTGKLVFSFALSLALHEIWEVFEFLFDSIFYTDHQHWQKHSPVVNHQPEKAVQPPGLVDTMTDTIAGIIGTIVACGGWWIFLAL